MLDLSAPPPYASSESAIIIREERLSITLLLAIMDFYPELLESEDRYRKAFFEAPIGMILASVDGRCLRVNPSLCQWLGFNVFWIWLELIDRQILHWENDHQSTKVPDPWIRRPSIKVFEALQV